MKIDASPIMLPEKDSGPRGARGDARDGEAGQAFGAAVKNAGEKAAGRQPERASNGNVARSKTDAANDDKAVEKDETAEAGEGREVAKPDALDLLALMAAIRKPEPVAEPQEGVEAADGGTTQFDAKGETLPDGADAPARPPRVQVLKTETHFEPRMEAIVVEGAAAAGKDEDQDRQASPLGQVPEADDLVARMAQQLQEPRGAAVRPAAAELAKAGERPQPAAAAAEDGGSSRRASSVPVRFDETLARLTQSGAAEGQGGAGSRQDGRDGGRRMPERTEAATASLRTEGRGEAASARVGSDLGTADNGPIPGLALQVASRIADALGSPTSNGSNAPRGGPAETAENAHLRMRAGGAALKTLTIQLQPEHLGTLEISMRLREGKLAIELAASKPEAAAALTQDRETLRKVLESAGFSIDDAALTVTTRDAPGLRASEASGGAGSSAGGDSSGSAFASSGQSGRRDEPRQREARTGSAGANESDAASRNGSAGSGSASRPAGQTYL